jgi:actinin alpha
MPFFVKKPAADAVMPARISAAAPPEDIAVHSKISDLRETHALQQLRTFTRWWNSVLKPRDIKMEDLIAEVSPGVNPITLYEELSGTFVRKYHKNPASRFQKLENQNLFLRSLKEKGLRLVNIGAEDLVDSNRTLILGLTWTLILRYEIQKYGASEQELLRWVKACTLGYKGVDITAWGESFNDGLAFCALLHKHDPNCLGYDALKPADGHGNLDKAFTVAEKRFGVPRLLEPDELAGPDSTDAKSVITYVAKLKQAFLDREAEMMRRLKEEEASRAAAARAARQADLKRMVGELESGVDAWTKWTKDKTAGFDKGARDAPALKEEAAASAREGLKRFRGMEKPPKAAEKARLADLFNRVSGEILADAMAAANEGYTPAVSEAQIAACAPDVLGAHWADMERAEREYEEALRRRMEAAEADRRAKATDDMLGALSKRADDLSNWLADKTRKMRDDAKSLGGPDDLAKKQAALDKLLAEEKPPKLSDTEELEREMRELGDRFLAEGRPAPPDLSNKLAEKWSGFDDAADALARALEDAKAKKAKEAAAAETDKKQADNEADSTKWLDKVAKKAGDFEKAVSTGDTGKTRDETQAKLNDLRSGFQGQAKPAWAAERAAIDDGRRDVDARRRAEDRPAAAWKPPNDALTAGWAKLGKAEREYEKALLDKLGALAEAEQERLRHAALKEKALADISGELPPLIYRRKVEMAAAAAAAEAAETAKDVSAWAAKQQADLEGKLAALNNDPTVVPDGPLAALDAFAEGDKADRLRSLLGARAAAVDALATRQIQRAGGGGPAQDACAAALPSAEAAWSAMEEAERRLKHALQARVTRAQGAALEWERLQRGVGRVTAWLETSTPQRMRTEIGNSEAEADALLGEARRTAAALELQTVAVARLAPLAARLARDDEFGPRATECFAQVEAVPSLAAPMSDRIAKLEQELERQRRLTAERLAFGNDTCALEAAIIQAQELLGFPVDTVDTPEIIHALRELGDKRASELIPPEGAEPPAIARAQAAIDAWRELASDLPARAAACEASHRAALAAQKLQADFVTAADAFNKWHGEVVALLSPPAAAGAVAASDVLRAAAIAAEQLPVGEAHARAAGVAARQMATYNIAQNPSVLTLSHMALALDQLRNLLSALHAAARDAPGNAAAPTARIVAALEDLAAGTKLSPTQLGGELGLVPEHVDFLRSEMDSAMAPKSFDPFPADRQPVPALPLPKVTLDLRAHGLSVIEHVNKARKEPNNYAAKLEADLVGAYEGSTFTCPPSWGGRKLRTAEGEPALQDLLRTLRKAPGNLPVLRLVSALDDAAQQLAEELGSGAASTTPLVNRLQARGTFSGSAGEAVVYGVRQPEAIAAQLLLSDGDQQRRNRSFLLNGDLKVAGFGLADHPAHGSVCVLVFTSLFATPIHEAAQAECQAEPSELFMRIIDAIPSEQARDIATDALVIGKKVQLGYTPGAVDITVTERDGSQRCSTLKWA